MSNAPYEIVAQPFTLWVAALATAFPLIDAAPDGNWTKVGTSGDLNYMEDGVTVAHSQSVESWRALGSTGRGKHSAPRRSSGSAWCWWTSPSSSTRWP
ncbi:hypothetical protein LCGC14_1434980 [marine sediment metagenome]|uniref:Uncharacterized protein n=1 Tax=marine sediment metagenome TaxID=412755 RepID=A0A0F9M2Z3_9ZZZZ